MSLSEIGKFKKKAFSNLQFSGQGRLDLRDYFAAQVAAALVKNCDMFISSNKSELIAKKAYEIADYMVKKRRR